MVLLSQMLTWRLVGSRDTRVFIGSPPQEAERGSLARGDVTPYYSSTSAGTNSAGVGFDEILGFSARNSILVSLERQISPIACFSPVPQGPARAEVYLYAPPTYLAYSIFIQPAL